MSPNFTIFGLFILVFEISTIIQKQLVAMLRGHTRFVCRNCTEIVKTDYGSEMVVPLYITGCRKKTYSESAIVGKWRRLIRAIYSLNTASDIKRYRHLRTLIGLVSGFFLMLCACWEANEIRSLNLLFTQYFEFAIYCIKHHIIANKEVKEGDTTFDLCVRNKGKVLSNPDAAESDTFVEIFLVK